MEKNLIYASFIIAGLFLVGIYLLLSLNAFSFITGRATTQNENLTITVGGFTAVTVSVMNNSLPSASISNQGTGSMLFYVTVSDADGASDINITSVKANFTKAGEPARQNSSCVKVGADLSSTSQNYSCTVDMWYFDDYGTWSVTVAATDLGNTTLIQNTTTNFYLPSLSGIVISPETLTWATVSQGTNNQEM